MSKDKTIKLEMRIPNIMMPSVTKNRTAYPPEVLKDAIARFMIDHEERFETGTAFVTMKDPLRDDRDLFTTDLKDVAGRIEKITGTTVEITPVGPYANIFDKLGAGHLECRGRWFGKPGEPPTLESISVCLKLPYVNNK